MSPIDAHKRLLAMLPVRTHELSDRDPHERITPETRLRRPWKERYTGTGAGGSNRQAVRFGGRVYASRRTAAIALGIARSTLDTWIETGRATLEKRK